MIVVEGQQLARSGAPCVEHGQERGVLRQLQTHTLVSETTVVHKAYIGLHGRYGSGAATYGLKIIVGYPAYGMRRREHGSAHAVATGYVLGTSFGYELATGDSYIAKVYGIEIVGAATRGYQFYAIVQRLVEPKGVEIILRNTQQKRYLIERTYFGKGTRSITRRGHHQHATEIVAHTSAHAERLRLFERACSHTCSTLREPTVESDIQIIKPQLLGQRLATVGHRRCRTRKSTPQREPIAETIYTLLLGPHVYTAFGILGPYERGVSSLRIVENPAAIVERAAGGYIFKTITRWFKIANTSILRDLIRKTTIHVAHPESVCLSYAKIMK